MSVLTEKAIVAMSSGKDHIDPDTHCFGGRRRQMIDAVERLHTESGHLLISVINIDVVD